MADGRRLGSFPPLLPGVEKFEDSKIPKTFENFHVVPKIMCDTAVVR